MKGRPDLIKPEIDNILSVMSDNPRSFSPETHPVIHTFELIWQRILNVCSIPQPQKNKRRRTLIAVQRSTKGTIEERIQFASSTLIRLQGFGEGSNNIRRTTSIKSLNRLTPKYSRSIPIWSHSLRITGNLWVLSQCYLSSSNIPGQRCCQVC